MYKTYGLVYYYCMATITDTAVEYAQPWWTRNAVTYVAVYYARTLVRAYKALSTPTPADNARTITYA